MRKKNKVDYASAGVSLKAADDAVKRIKSLAQKTFTENVLSDIGSFGGLFRLPVEDYRNPVLVSSTDSVGTKLKLAFMSGIHTTVGRDIVNHCVNDILVQGARPPAAKTACRFWAAKRRNFPASIMKANTTWSAP
jgi:phosphoribosylformylglycinamidine cyclo-ligase